ncbi:ribosome biogenesis regulatory protein-domain-containing protein [Alternaria rosae]|uniref:ribosome biogenesis regulatory protein-domain-containing protein n=1 Tax=Alternaria rosae TaxID=1187941 RepID=UPI001E8D8F2B|nr:ribosome biogenesis regulatory protein-domain-containing protein [Alternaria rosae]KAH6839675.1 ribosome biogenesis regulatory protein-domain-containing protein [Alternaria rosae]
MDVKSNGAPSVADSTVSSRLPITVNKPTPFTFDLGNLLANDPNPLLSTCEIKSNSEGVHLVLPAPTTPLPREKPIPEAKEPTKWDKFAAKKGIKNKKRDTKLAYDEATGDWVPKWGYKGKNKAGENDWLVEVDEKKEAKTERKERMRRNERKERANSVKSRKVGGVSWST